MSYPVDWELSAAVATTAVAFVAVFISLVGIWVENRRSNLATRATMLREFLNEFDYALRAHRHHTAQYLLARLDNKTSDPPGWQILDFFTMVGDHYRRGLLDLDLTWGAFNYWLGFYYNLMREDARANLDGQLAGTEYYRSLDHLYKELPAYGQSHYKQPAPAGYYTTDRMRRFLMDEIRETSSSES